MYILYDFYEISNVYIFFIGITQCYLFDHCLEKNTPWVYDYSDATS